MKLTALPDADDISVGKIEVVSGIRPSGLTINNSNGRISHGFFYVYDGEAILSASGKKPIRVKSGMLVYLPRRHKYVTQYSARNTTFVTVNFEITNGEKENVEVADEISVLVTEDRNYKLANIMKNFELCSGSKNASATFRKKELLYRLLNYVCESDGLAFYEKTNPGSTIFKGVALLHQSYLENLSVAELAKASNVSESTFRSLFKATFKTSPIQYRNKLRIERAISLLAEGDNTVVETAYACGFENIGYFYRYFKKVTGKTPLSFIEGKANEP